MIVSWPSKVFIFSFFFALLSACGVLSSSTPDIPAPDEYYLTSRPENRVSGKIFEVQAGESIRFFANKGAELTPEHQEVEVVTWSIDQAEGASIDSSGVLSTEKDLPHGTVITVSAHTEVGIIQTQVLVYSPEENPLVGNWKEIEPTSCGSENPIDELLFLADGRFFVTWRAFEWYVDYKGLYHVNLDAGSLEIFEMEEVNYLPDNVEDAAGTINIDEEGHLVIKDLYFGVPPEESPTSDQCATHKFEKR